MSFIPRTLTPLLLAVLPSLAAPADPPPADDRPFPDPHEDALFLPSPPGVEGGGLAAPFNPAAWATGLEAEPAFWWNDRDLAGGPRNWGFSIGRGLGYSLRRQTVASPGDGGADPRSFAVTDHLLGLAFGNRALHVGLGWRWSGEDDEAVGRETGLVIGTITRPSRYLSYGTSATFSTSSKASLGQMDVGIRPLGSPLLTVFGDATLWRGESIDDLRFGVGVETRPIPGLALSWRARSGDDGDLDHQVFRVGIQLDDLALDVLPGYDEGGDRTATSMVVRGRRSRRGAPVERMVTEAVGTPRYAALDLRGRTLSHQRDHWFDDRRVAWIDLLPRLDAVRQDPTLDGIAINLAGFRTSAAMGWELRRKLGEIRDVGKEVLVVTERTNLFGYHLASVGTEIWIDPQGMITVPGLAIQRTYFAEALERLGVGFDELRFQPYKTLYETYARDDMSSRDRDQYLALLDGLYGEVREDVTRSRSLEEGAFDRIVDDIVRLDPVQAVDEGLADRIGRWDDLPRFLRTERRGAEMVALPEAPARHPDERWGRPPGLAVVYAVGPCELEGGIRGRGASAFLRRAARRHDLDGVVIRVDSPGGDPLPADLYTDAATEVTDAGKPVVVSQAGVAASGGYWLGLESDLVLTTPLTMTGSIGVISAWVYDDGLAARLGVRAGGVQQGRHADLFAGLRVPLLGLRLPTRALTAEEREGIRARIDGQYEHFVQRVAASRKIDAWEVEKVAGGRVWAGRHALAHDLVDGIGGLDEALDEVRARAGLGPDDEVRIVEYPERARFRLPNLGPRLPGVGAILGMLGGEDEAPGPLADDPTLDYLRLVSRSPGAPLLLAPSGALPELRVGE